MFSIRGNGELITVELEKEGGGAVAHFTKKQFEEIILWLIEVVDQEKFEKKL